MSVYKLIINQSALQTVANVINIDTNTQPGGVNPYARPKYAVGSNASSPPQKTP